MRSVRPSPPVVGKPAAKPSDVSVSATSAISPATYLRRPRPLSIRAAEARSEARETPLLPQRGRVLPRGAVPSLHTTIFRIQVEGLRAPSRRGSRDRELLPAESHLARLADRPMNDGELEAGTESPMRRDITRPCSTRAG